MVSEIIFPLPFLPTSVNKEIYLGEDKKFGFLETKIDTKKPQLSGLFVVQPSFV